MGRRNIRNWPVMAAPCATCPFHEGGNADLACRVLDRTLLQQQQICHHPTLHGKRQTHLCRGARDVQLRVLHCLGFIPEPTDEAFTKRTDEVLGPPKTRSTGRGK